VKNVNSKYKVIEISSNVNKPIATSNALLRTIVRRNIGPYFVDNFCLSEYSVDPLGVKRVRVYDADEVDKKLIFLNEERRRLRKVLRKLDRLLDRSEVYKHLYFNHPKKPELTPRKMVRRALRTQKK
jgi:hypothetical protein